MVIAEPLIHSGLENPKVTLGSEHAAKDDLFTPSPIMGLVEALMACEAARLNLKQHPEYLPALHELNDRLTQFMSLFDR